MNSTDFEKGQNFLVRRLPDLGFIPSWIGRDPAGGYLLGSYEGEIRAVSDEFLPAGPTWLACPSGEAINGIAVVGRKVAISTGTEIYLHDLDAVRRPSDGAPIYDGGAFGIIATRSGAFVAPLGTDGLLGITDPEDPASSTWTTGVEGKEVNFLEAVSLAADGTNDVIAVAARRDGLGIVNLSRDRGPGGLDSARFSVPPGFDAISVCSMSSPGSPYAVACLGSDLSVYVWRDARKDEPANFGIGVSKASAYSISHSNGHLFVHTSRGVAVLVDLASGYLGGDERFSDYKTGFIPLEASDLVVIDDIGFEFLESSVAAFLVADIAEMSRSRRPLGAATAKTNQIARKFTDGNSTESLILAARLQPHAIIRDENLTSKWKSVPAA